MICSNYYITPKGQLIKSVVIGDEVINFIPTGMYSQKGKIYFRLKTIA